ncbi:MAG: hypothetical protein WD055_00470 [Candidatus Dependentiae bacterium]
MHYAVKLNIFNSAAIDDFQVWFNNLKKVLYHIKHDKNSQKHRADLRMILTHIFDLASVQLVDAVILHEVYKNQVTCNTDSAIFICVGRAHMLEVEKLLPALDYKKIDACFNIKGVDVERFCALYIKPTSATDEHTKRVQDIPFWLRIVSVIKYCIGFFGN